MNPRRVAVAVVASTLLLAGCGTTGVAGGPLKEVTFVNPLLGDPGWDRYGECLSKAGADHGIKVRIVGPPGDKLDVAAMEEQVSQAIATHTQAIVTWPSGAPAAFDALFAKARGQGILVATYLGDRNTTHQNFQVDTGSPEELMRTILGAIAARPGHQSLGILSQRQGASLGDPSEVRRIVAAFPNVSISDIRYDYADFASDVDLVSAMLAAHPEINVVYNYNTFAGVLTAIRERGMTGKVFAVTGFLPNNVESVVKAIDDGLIADVAVVDWCGAAKTTIDRLVDASQGKAVQPVYGGVYRVVPPEEFKKLAAEGKL